MITDLKINEEKKKEYYEKGYWTHDTIRDVWERQARANADKEYVADDQGCRMTYGEVDDAASRLAAWLVSQGIKPGDVVTLQFPNWAEFTIAYVACFKAGAVIQSLARNFNGADLTYAMNLVESRAYIGPTSFHGVDYEQQILDIAGDIPTLKVIALVDKKAPKQTDLPTVAEIVATTEPLAEKVPVESDQVACLLSTSGTTGKPKEVMLTHNNILFSERVFVEGLERTADDVMWMPAPLNHAVGFFHGLVAPMLLGGRSVLMQDFAVTDAIDLINAEGATWSMCCTPAAARRCPGRSSTAPTTTTFCSARSSAPRRAARTCSCPRANAWNGTATGPASPSPASRCATSMSRETMWPRASRASTSPVARTSSSAT